MIDLLRLIKKNSLSYSKKSLSDKEKMPLFSAMLFGVGEDLDRLWGNL